MHACVVVYSTYDKKVLVFHAGKYALAGLLPCEQEQAVFASFDACSLIWRKVIRRADLPRLQESVLGALHQVQMALPCSVATIVMHNMTHMVPKIVLLGPLYITSMFPFERSYRLLRSWIAHQLHVESSLIKNIRANFMQVMCLQEYSCVLKSSRFAC